MLLDTFVPSLPQCSVACDAVINTALTNTGEVNSIKDREITVFCDPYLLKV